MDLVNAVKIEIEFEPDKSGGQLRVEINSKEYLDSLVVFTNALYRDKRLRLLVQESLEFLASPDFKQVIEKHGL